MKGQLSAEGTEAGEADQPRLHDRAVEGSGTCALVVWLHTPGSVLPAPPTAPPFLLGCGEVHLTATAGPSLGPAHRLWVDTGWSKDSGSGGTASQRIPPAELGTCCSALQRSSESDGPAGSAGPGASRCRVGNAGSERRVLARQVPGLRKRRLWRGLGSLEDPTSVHQDQPR